MTAIKQLHITYLHYKICILTICSTAYCASLTESTIATS
ncbi:unnamed protein product [Acanthoscelides obtectus]|uniref:Uncharacterized protein n=1 Tax=Acanthoscelides obtectus TaxID=200917 RepID=A0A9P0PCH0_ACAOB|nr:unnamed protein product [Acanthoscelides obtectus]CAK1660048.1 hypothetical protein AOBTE_LOCUS21845 [Acanthoscelides obtectus]